MKEANKSSIGGGRVMASMDEVLKMRSKLRPVKRKEERTTTTTADPLTRELELRITNIRNAKKSDSDSDNDNDLSESDWWLFLIKKENVSIYELSH